ncbi:hypothetical protein D3C80_1575690 [compost metagenome]
MTKAPISRKASKNSQGSPASRKCRVKPSSRLRGCSERGRKFRDSGSTFQNTTAAIRARLPITSSAVCQLTKSISTPVIRRPLMPPMALPPIYRPMARPMCCGWISSLRYVIATAARPLSDSPSSARLSSTPCQLGISALTRVHRAAQNRANTITGLRPMRSEMGPVISKPIASMPVDTERIRLLCAALMENSWDSSGIIGCTQ